MPTADVNLWLYVVRDGVGELRACIHELRTVTVLMRDGVGEL